MKHAALAAALVATSMLMGACRATTTAGAGSGVLPTMGGEAPASAVPLSSGQSIEGSIDCNHAWYFRIEVPTRTTLSFVVQGQHVGDWGSAGVQLAVLDAGGVQVDLSGTATTVQAPAWSTMGWDHDFDGVSYLKVFKAYDDGCNHPVNYRIVAK